MEAMGRNHDRIKQFNGWLSNDVQGGQAGAFARGTQPGEGTWPTFSQFHLLETAEFQHKLFELWESNESMLASSYMNLKFNYNI